MADAKIHKSVAAKMRAHRDDILQAYRIIALKERVPNYSEAHTRLALTAMLQHVAAPEEDWQAQVKAQIDAQVKAGGAPEHGLHILQTFPKIIKDKCRLTGEEAEFIERFYAQAAKELIEYSRPK